MIPWISLGFGMQADAEVWARLVERYCERRADEFTTPQYKRRTRSLLLQVGRALARRRLACHPSKFGPRQIRFVGNVLWSNSTADRRGIATSTRRQWLGILNQFLMDYRPRITFGQRDRTPRQFADVRESVVPRIALTRDQARRVLAEARRLGPVQHGIIAFELTMGLRRSEVLRLTVNQARHEIINLLGKGWRGGKWREVPRSRLVERLLPRILRARRTAVRGFSGEDPGYLFCHVWQGRIRPFSAGWVDRNCLIPVFRATGIDAPGNLNHSLRRTFGRTLWEEGVPIELVSQIMGHAETRMTRRYLALDLNDMVSAIDRLDRVFAKGTSPGSRMLPLSAPKGGDPTTPRPRLGGGMGFTRSRVRGALTGGQRDIRRPRRTGSSAPSRNDHFGTPRRSVRF